jgi:ssRNA-specific RNase YbeY (16S rRNA maturation enzyme)
MIHFFYENTSEIIEENIKPWIEKIIITEEKRLGEINYIFCDDEYLLKINQDFLQHDYYTDIITFDKYVEKQFQERFLYLCKELRIMLVLFQKTMKKKPEE